MSGVLAACWQEVRGEGRESKGGVASTRVTVDTRVDTGVPGKADEGSNITVVGGRVREKSMTTRDKRGRGAPCFIHNKHVVGS